MKLILKLQLLLLLIGCIGFEFSLNTNADEKPNIILIMADDLGWGDTGYNGNKIIKTPHLDQMAHDGLRFDRFYSGSSVCSPTRASCLTGRNGYRMGIRTANQGHLPKYEICLAEVLKRHGYATGHFGKWHLGTLAPDYSGKGQRRNPKKNFSHPGMNGFDEWFSTEFAVATWDPYRPENSHLGNRMKFDTRALYWHNGKNVEETLKGDDSRIIMDQAIPFMERSAEQNKPFFSVIWFHTPHAPVVGGPEYRKRYSNHDQQSQHYYACVDAMDEQIGRLRRQLKKLGCEQNTLIWFCSDNGPEGANPAGKFMGSQGNLRGRKRSLYEGGIRVPGILVWPEKIHAASKTDLPCVTSDFFPTVCQLVGETLPKDREYDGTSLLPLIHGQEQTRRSTINFQFGQQAVAMERRYKLVANRNPQKRPARDTSRLTVARWELYDIESDPNESSNLVNDQPDVAARLKKQLAKWQQSCETEFEKLKNQLTSEKQP